jgi:NTE family protein
LKELVATAIIGRDQTHLDRPGVRERTMSVDTSGTGIVEFAIGDAERRQLVARGRQAAVDFLAKLAAKDADDLADDLAD